MANMLEDLLVDTLMRGQVEGGQKAVVRFLSARFGSVPTALQARIEGVGEVAQLDALVAATATVGTLEEFGQVLDRIAGVAR